MKPINIITTIIIIITLTLVGVSFMKNRYNGFSVAGETRSQSLKIIATANTEQSHIRGLMYRREPLPDASGMLFIYDPPKMASMWMKNTFIPLDVLYLDAARRVVHIVENMVPHSLDSHNSTVPVTYAIEINGGESSRLGIETGMTIEFLT